MNRFVPTALTTVALLVPASVLAPSATAARGQAGTAVTGTWKGQVFGDKGADAGYSARVRIFKRNGELRGRVASRRLLRRVALPRSFERLVPTSPKSSPATRPATA